MQIIFISQDLWDIVEGSYAEPPQPHDVAKDWTTKRQREYKENVKKDACALRYIQQGISKAIYPRIFGAKKAKQAWEILKEGFQGNEKVISLKLQSLWRDFDNMKMKEGQGMQSFLTKVTEVVNQIRSLGDIIEDRKVVQKVLRSLPTNYDHVVTAIEESKDLFTYTFSELMSSLQVHEERMNRSSIQPLEQAFQTKLNTSEKKIFKQKYKG